MKKYRFFYGGAYYSFETLKEAFDNRDEMMMDIDDHSVGPIEVLDSFGKWVTF